MSKPFKFEPSDFNTNDMSPRWLAQLANAKLQEWLASAPVVYGQGVEAMRSAMWCMNGPDAEVYKHTHSARLVDIQELPKKKCEHRLDLSKAVTRYETGIAGNCKRCGVPLTAVWKESES